MNAKHLVALFDRVSDASGAVDRLRGLVLNLAVRGLLIPQDDMDEPATAVLGEVEKRRRAHDEASSLRRAHKREPPEPFDAPFSIPEPWELTTLGWLCRKIGSGSTPRGGKRVYTSAGVPFIRSQNVYNDGLRMEGVARIPETIHQRMSGTCVLPDDILLNITGASIGRCALVPADIGEANVSQHVSIIRLFLPSLREFIHLALCSPMFQDQIQSVQVGVSREGLSARSLRRFPMPVPPLAEQNRIVARVKELMAVCSDLEEAQQLREQQRGRLARVSQRRMIEEVWNPESFRTAASFYLQRLSRLATRPDHISDIRRSIRSLAERGKLVGQQGSNGDVKALLQERGISTVEDGPFTLPSSWAWVELRAVSERRLGKMLDRAKNRGSPRRYLRNVNVRWFDFDLTDVQEMPFEDSEVEEFSLLKGDVMICEGGEPGRAAVWDEREPGVLFQKAVHRVRFPDFVQPDYFVNVMKTAADSGRLKESFTGAGIKHLTGKGLATFLLPLPPLAEQGRILAAMKGLMDVCDELEARLGEGLSRRSLLLDAVVHEALAEH